MKKKPVGKLLKFIAENAIKVEGKIVEATYSRGFYKNYFGTDNAFQRYTNNESASTVERSLSHLIRLIAWGNDWAIIIHGSNCSTATIDFSKKADALQCLEILLSGMTHTDSSGKEIENKA